MGRISGPTGGSDIGVGVFDPVPIHSGRGRGDAPPGCLDGCLNDWLGTPLSDTSAEWIALTPIPHRDLIGADATGVGGAAALVPGFTVFGPGTDGLGDIATDGRPDVFPNPVVPKGEGNVADGFVLQVTDWDVGEMLSFNWFLLDEFLAPIGMAGTNTNSGNDFGFGIINLARIAVGDPSLPGAVFEGNTGASQSPTLFFDDVFNIPNPAEFAAEFGAGITGEFLEPLDNLFDAPVNTSLLVPEPATAALLVWGGIAVAARLRRRRRT